MSKKMTKILEMIETLDEGQKARLKEIINQPEYKTVTNLMTGKEIRIRKDTPMCCDPSTERYWSM